MRSPSPLSSWRAVAVAALSLSALAGCGSDGDQAEATTPAAVAGGIPAGTSIPGGKRDPQSDGFSVAVHVTNANPANGKLAVEVPPTSSIAQLRLVHRHDRTDKALKRGEKLVTSKSAIKQATVVTQQRTRFLFESTSGKTTVSNLHDLGGGQAPLALLTWDTAPAERSLDSLLAQPVDEVRVIEPSDS